MTALRISRLHFPVTTLGPGRRVGVWFQGCAIRCAGCISADTWDPSVGETTLAEVLASLEPWAEEADGLTVSGGEPFEQPAALEALLRAWRRIGRGDALVFTGYPIEAVQGRLAAWDGLIDALVSGPFDRQAPQTLALRGSDNQVLSILTEAGERFRAFDRPAGEMDRRLDVMFDADGGAWFAGIPARGDFQKMRQALKAKGHRVILSADQGRSLS